MSANNVVIVLHSPSAREEAVTSLEITISKLPNGGRWRPGGSITGRQSGPTIAQNRLPGGFSASHLRQRIVNGAPQSPQNFLPVGLSPPHLEQRIGFPEADRFASHLSPRAYVNHCLFSRSYRTLTEHAPHVYGCDWSFMMIFTVAEPICCNAELKWCSRLFRKRASQPKLRLPLRVGRSQTFGRVQMG
jgi:hypothetical protein